MPRSIMRNLFPGQHISRHTGLPTGHHHRHHHSYHAPRVLLSSPIVYVRPRTVYTVPEPVVVHTHTIATPVLPPVMEHHVASVPIQSTHTVVHHQPKQDGAKVAACILGALSVIAGIALFIFGIIAPNPGILCGGIALIVAGAGAIVYSAKRKLEPENEQFVETQRTAHHSQTVKPTSSDKTQPSSQSSVVTEPSAPSQAAPKNDQVAMEAKEESTAS